MSGDLGVGIVGLGMIAEFHARAIAAAEGANLVACFSRTRERAEAFASQHGCTCYDSLQHFLADPALDLVAVCSPSGAHLQPALAAAAAGKHVLCEKPLEVTIERVDRMILAVRTPW